jgi:ferric iron reductase protein FhuF
LKAIETSIQRAITWIKKSGKRRTKWKDVCIIARLLIKILKKITKMQFVSKKILFLNTFTYQNVMSIYYG